MENTFCASPAEDGMQGLQFSGIMNNYTNQRNCPAKRQAPVQFPADAQGQVIAQGSALRRWYTRGSMPEKAGFPVTWGHPDGIRPKQMKSFPEEDISPHRG